MSRDRERRPDAGSVAHTTSAGADAPGKRSLTQRLERREATGQVDSLEATRGARNPEGAADRASGRALEQRASESIESIVRR
jgi:hypothetical protein